jgi:hypothetical protein
MNESKTIDFHFLKLFLNVPYIFFYMYFEYKILKACVIALISISKDIDIDAPFV